MCCRTPKPELASVYLNVPPQPRLENGITIKVVTVGTYAIGKTQLIRALIDEQFSADSTSTIGVAMFAGRLNAQDEPMAFKAIFWDTAGQERFDSITVGYYRDANIVLLCYDLSTGDDQTEMLQSYITKIATNCKASPVVILVGTKLDIANSKRPPSEVAYLANYQRVEVSAKTRVGIDQLKLILLDCAKVRYRQWNNLIELEPLRTAQRLKKINS